MSDHPLPLPLEDATTAGWWAATRERRLVLQTCAACGHTQHYPRPLCLACGGDDLAFREASGRGTVHAATAVHRPPLPDLAAPYVIALVDLDEGPRLMTRIVARGEDPAGPSALASTVAATAALAGQRVAVSWWPLPDGRALPVFTPDPSREA